MEIVSRRGMALHRIIGQGRDGMISAQDAAKRLGLSYGEDAKTMEQVAHAQRELKVTFDALGKATTVAFARSPIIKEQLQAYAFFLTDITEGREAANRRLAEMQR